MFYLDISFKDKQTIRRNCTFADYHLVVSGSVVTSGMCASYVETYQSWEKVSEGQAQKAYEPYQDYIGYETELFYTGCFYDKCPNGYAYYLTNRDCQQGHRSNRSWAPGWPQCPHGYPYSGTDAKEAHCFNDSGFDKPGYRAPCGRTTRMEGEQWGYVTRTRTTSYNKEAGCLSSTLYDKSDASISTRMVRNSYSRSCTSSPT